MVRAIARRCSRRITISFPFPEIPFRNSRPYAAHPRSSHHRWSMLLPALALILSLGYRNQHVTEPTLQPPPAVTSRMIGTVVCQIDVLEGTSECWGAQPGETSPSDAGHDLVNEAKFTIRTGTGAYTPADSTFRWPVRIVNIDQDFLGSPDGQEMTGIKLFLSSPPEGTGNRATGDTAPSPAGVPRPGPSTGTGQNVWARNHDGVLNFTGPDQPYWNYAEKLTLGEYSQWRELHLKIAPNVTRISVSFGIFTAVPGEPTIPATPPLGYLISDDSLAVLYAKERQIWVHPRVAGPYPPDVVHITFRPTATQDEKQAALDIIGGRVIGGRSTAYYVLVPLDNSAQGAVWTAIDRLVMLPQVLHADPDVLAGLVVHTSHPDAKH